MTARLLERSIYARSMATEMTGEEKSREGSGGCPSGCSGLGARMLRAL